MKIAYQVTLDPARRALRIDYACKGPEAKLIAEWLEVPFDPIEGQAYALAFYENFHGMETAI